MTMAINPYHSESPVPQQRSSERKLRLVDGDAALPEGAAVEAKHERSWVSLRLLPSAPIVSLADYRAGWTSLP